ncbi:MAG TPA: hypothetical protein G4N92_01890 [Anaerolineae bacterium]|nr:hypothetical protein [Anaerolineae bacterium]
MGLLYWIIGLLDGYHLTRSSNPWISLAMGGFALLTKHFFNLIFNRTDGLLKALRKPRIISFTPKEKIDLFGAQLRETKEVGYLLLE